MINRRLGVSPQPPSESFGPGVIGDFQQIGDATMAIANGMLTTADVTQADAILPGGSDSTWFSHDALAPENAGVPTLRGDYSVTRSQGIFAVDNTSQVAGYVGINGIDALGDTNLTGNFAGDLLVVRNSGPYLSDTSPPGYWTPVGIGFAGGTPNLVMQDTYVWSGSDWRLIWHYVGPSPTTLGWIEANQGEPGNWEALTFERAQPPKSAIYACNWSEAGALREGVKFRCTVQLPQRVPVSNLFGGFGLTMGMTDIDHGLTYTPSGGPSGGACWTKKPSDLRRWGTHYPPERVQSDGTYCRPGQHPLGGTLYAAHAVGENIYGVEYADIHGAGGYGQAFLQPDINYRVWAEIWRQNNTAYGALYSQDPETLSEPAVAFDFAESLVGGPYADGTPLQFGLVFPWLATNCGLLACEIVRLT